MVFKNKYLSKINKRLAERRFSGWTLIFLGIAIFMFILMTTDFFRNWLDLLKIGFVMGWWIFGYIIGISTTGKIREIMESLTSILLRKDQPWEEREHKMLMEIRHAYFILGLLYEEKNIEQGTNFRSEEQKKKGY